MGNNAQGPILFDQVQGVREATPPDGITIDVDGTIHFDAATSRGAVKLNNPTAFNGYVWPTTPGTAGQQLEIDGSQNLFWSDADGIDWTMKGQLIVGIGVGPTQDTLLNPGADNWVLKTRSSTVSGLEWSPLYVDVKENLQGAAVIPVGLTAQRPPAAITGYFRANTTQVNVPTFPTEFMEYYDGSTATWQQLVTWAQANSIAIDMYSNNIAGYILANLPVVPAFATGAQVVVPAGYDSFYITSTLSLQANWNTTTTGIASLQHSVKANPGNIACGYNAVQFANGSNQQPQKINSSVTGTLIGNPAQSYTFRQEFNKDAANGVIATADYNIAVLAWRTAF
jgi:hypothetical protein